MSGGNGEPSVVDINAPVVSIFKLKNGESITASGSASYAVSGNIGNTQEYTLSFSEKLDAASYIVKMLDSNNVAVALPIGMIATFVANDASNLAYTLSITTDNRFAFDAGQGTGVVKLQVIVADVSHNAATVNIRETVNHVDTPGVVTITGPVSSSGNPTLRFSANDIDGIASWEVIYVRFRSNAVILDPQAQAASGAGQPPSILILNGFMNNWAVGNRADVWLKIYDSFGNLTESQPIQILKI